jgi:hypothetical protein
VPFHWVRMASSPPQQKLDDVLAACAAQQNVTLVTGQIYYGDEDNIAFALIEVPAGQTPAQQKVLLTALKAIESHGKVDANEKQKGDRPPPDSGQGHP